MNKENGKRALMISFICEMPGCLCGNGFRDAAFHSCEALFSHLPWVIPMSEYQRAHRIRQTGSWCKGECVQKSANR